MSHKSSFFANGHVTTLSDDVYQRLTQQEWVIPGAGGGTFRMSYAYNAADQQVSITYPGGNNGQAGEVVTHSYNSVGQLTGVSGNGVQYLSAAAYNPLGQATELRLDAGSNGLWRNFDYNAGTLRLETLRAGKNANHDDIQKLSYSYDNVGNVLSITDALNANQTQTFGYDWLNRLTSAATNAAGTGQYSHSYSYDAIGNITARDGQSYTYGSQPHAATAALGNSYGYDGNGNMTTRVIAGVTYTLSYDDENRLVEVKQGASAVATFIYDADGARVKGRVQGVTTVYIAGVYEWQNGASTSYYEGPTGPLALRRAGHGTDNGVKYLLSDHLRSTSVLLNRDGSVAARNYYHPYGDARSPLSSLTTKRFTGQYHEAALGLYFYNARWYDPLLGRFAQADAIVPAPGDPQSLNRYSYVRNNPLRYVDPSGHIPCYGDPLLGECSWSGTDHHAVPQRRRRRDIAAYTRFILREVRNPEAGVTDVEAFAQVLDFAAGFGTDTKTWADDISSVILGVTGPFTLVTALPVKFREWRGGPRLPEFGDTGFHEVYQDGHNQVYHWWAYVNTAIQGAWPGTAFVGVPANYVHEFADLTESLKPPDKRGASWQDYGLSYNGLAFGLALHEGTITPNTAADAARFALTTDLRDPVTRWLAGTGNEWLPPNVVGAGLDWLLGR